MRSSRLVAGLTLSAAIAVPAMATGAEGGGGSSLISPDVGTMFWTFVTFLALVFLLGRFAWKPLIGALEAREGAIKSTIDKTNKDRGEAEDLLKQHRQLLEQARRERAEAVAAGQQDAERLKTEILDGARAQRDQLLQQTQAQVAAEMREARGDLRKAAVDLSIQAAGKLLSKNLDDATQRKLVEDHLSDLERSAGSNPLPS